MKKLNAGQIQMDIQGQTFRRAVVYLNEGQSIAELRETPDAFANVQANINTRLGKGDVVDVLTHDGLQMSEGHRVLWFRGEELELSKPLRLLEFREVGLYEDDHYAVIPVGTGYGVRQKRTGHSDGRQFRTEEAAKQEIILRQTTRAA